MYRASVLVSALLFFMAAAGCSDDGDCVPCRCDSRSLQDGAGGDGPVADGSSAGEQGVSDGGVDLAVDSAPALPSLHVENPLGWASAQGGKGGAIIKVTTLAASGAGSLREALATKGKRIIVFEVGGVIDLAGKSLSIKEPYVTISGQTAPSPGITIIDGALSISTHHVVVQHLRIRPGAKRHTKGWEPDGITLYKASDVIIDHCSLTWAVDENIGISGPRHDGATLADWRSNTSHRVTVSHCLIAEALSDATHAKGPHSKGTLIHDNATDIAMVGNLFASNVDRNPLLKGGGQAAVINNLIDNPKSIAISYNLSSSEWSGHTPVDGKLTIVGNVLQHGPDTNSGTALLRLFGGICKTFMDDNLAFDTSGQAAKLVYGSPDAANFITTKDLWHTSFQPLAASAVKAHVLATAGASPNDRDAIDQRIVDAVKQGKGKIIDYETEVGGFPQVTPTQRPFDASQWRN